MITDKELININKKSELNLYQQEKEYLLKLFLYFYYKKFEDAIFKGGTAIRFIYNLNRFSEDLDFNITIHPKEFQKQVKETLKEITNIGIKNKFKKQELFEKAYTCEIIFEGPLYKGTTQIRNKFRIDAGKRLKTIKNSEWKIIKSEYPETKENFLVKVINIEEILAEKIIAIFTRNKGRDLYDSWFLLNLYKKINKKLIEQKLKIFDHANNISQKLKNNTLNIKTFTKELEYNKDLKHLTSKLVPYAQVKEEVIKKLYEAKILN